MNTVFLFSHYAALHTHVNSQTENTPPEKDYVRGKLCKWVWINTSMKMGFRPYEDIDSLQAQCADFHFFPSPGLWLLKLRAKIFLRSESSNEIAWRLKKFEEFSLSGILKSSKVTTVSVAKQQKCQVLKYFFKENEKGKRTTKGWVQGPR